MDLGIAPLKIKNMFESNPLKSEFLVRGLAATTCADLGEPHDKLAVVAHAEAAERLQPLGSLGGTTSLTLLV